MAPSLVWLEGGAIAGIGGKRASAAQAKEDEAVQPNEHVISLSMYLLQMAARRHFHVAGYLPWVMQTSPARTAPASAAREYAVKYTAASAEVETEVAEFR